MALNLGSSFNGASWRPDSGTFGPDDMTGLDLGTQLVLTAALAKRAGLTALPSATAAPTAAPIPAFDISTGKAVTTAFALNTIQVADPEAKNQWHLQRLGDLQTVWKDYTGEGVSVGVYDSGVQYAHWDLDGNYDATNHVVVDGKTYDGDYRPASGPHGTSVAGLIAAERNGAGGVGVAYGADVTGVNIFDPYSEDDAKEGIFVNGADLTQFFEAVKQSARYDVTNHSWGGLDYVTTAAARTTAGSFANGMVEALGYGSAEGRDGLGTVHVAAAGNDVIDGQADSWKSDRHVVTVGSYREVDGSSSYYVDSGAHLLVAAPSNDYAELGGTGQVTTDLLGRDGYNTLAKPGGAEDYTDTFGGTSGATPVVSGVVSLILDANPELGWRDVKDILAASAKLPVAFDTGQTAATSTISGLTYVLNNRQFQLNGDAAGWNGGAMHYSNDYGYGAVDAYNAVRLAEAWSLFGAAKTSANEVSATTGTIKVGKTSVATKADTALTQFSDFVGTPTSFQFRVTQNVDVEHLDLTLNFATLLGDGTSTLNTSAVGLKIKLIAPDGTEGYIDLGDTNATTVTGASQTFTFGLSGFRGVDTLGTWTLQFEQTAGVFGTYDANRTTVNTLKLDLYGAAPSDGDVYTYTNEFFTMAAIAGESGRRTLVDSDGGTDWINAAAIASDVVISLKQGGVTSFGGTKAFTIGATTQIENAVSGDGNDTLNGNALANELHGMRGNDSLYGDAGNDWLWGGLGDDRLDGGTGADVLRGEQGNDTYVVDNKGDVVIEDPNGGLDTVYTKIDYALGANVENLYLAGAARSGTGNALDNGLYGGGGDDTLYGLDGNDLLKGWTGNDRLYGGSGNDTLHGGAGNDWLDGGSGNDVLRGEAGNDTYVVDSRADQVIEALGEGLDTVWASVDYRLTANVENLTLTGTAYNGTGNALGNVIRGTAGANALSGEAGNDTLIGGAGNDMLTGGSGADRFVFADGFGKDTIRDFGQGDTIDLAAYTLVGAPVLTDLGSDTLIDLGGGNTILLRGIDPGQLNFTGDAFGFVG
ncbi:S8 family serine peptidase [Sphingomonas sp. BK235]|uniref:S8 family serine peptidase n=1 Tax=Sphingomonas sp. BK235 TaxID=2512131 RepID=UPI00104EB5EE|nr:S8 family serine peptidase [Sphingomonas sp. BK235]